MNEVGREARSRVLMPICLLYGIGAITLALWTLALADFSGTGVEKVARDVKIYCFGFDPESSQFGIGRTLAMAMQPFFLSALIGFVWRRELFPSSRPRKSVWVLLLLVATWGTVLLVPARSPVASASVALQRRHDPAPDFVLSDQEGQRSGLSELQGKVVGLTFVYRSCQHTCPLQMKKMLELQAHFADRLGRDLWLVAVSLDPERDTPALLQEYAQLQGADPRGWTLFSGSPDEIKKVLDDYQLPYKWPEGFEGDQQIGHAALIAVIDRRGRRAYDFYGATYPTEWIVEKIQKLLRE